MLANIVRRVGRSRWRFLTIACGIVLYAVATNGQAYELTSPTSLPIHAALRKTYALLAFALLGFLLKNADVPRWRGALAVALAVGLYSGAIEIGQIVIGHVRETLGQHAFDVGSGVAGGMLGAVVAGVISGSSDAAGSRRDAVLVLLFLVAVMWGYTVTYG